MSWVWLVAPLIALFGPLAIPFFGVMESITSGALTNMDGSTLLDVTYVSPQKTHEQNERTPTNLDASTCLLV